MVKEEFESIGMILDDEGLGLQLGNSENILRVHLEGDGKAEPEPFSTVAIQKDDAVLWHAKGIEQKVEMARKQGASAANATYIEALKTVIEFHRALTIDEFCALTGCHKKTVQNKIKTFPVKHFRRAGRLLFDLEDTLRYMGVFNEE
jgi:hypothetical protein